MTLRLIPVLLCFFAFSASMAQPSGEASLNVFVEDKLSEFPVPPAKHNRLFYLQRNKNSNTVVYEANLLPDGSFDPDRPVSVYWIRYDEGNVIKELNWIQRWLAYGVDSEPVGDGTGNYVVTPVALKSRKLTLTRGDDGRPVVYLDLKGRKARLDRIYAEASETSWLPTVKFVQLKGVAVESGKEVVEYIFPKNN